MIPLPSLSTTATDYNVADVVIYARYSSAGQNDQSIDGQLDACTQYAHQRGFRVIGQYIDRALSGTQADSRPDFQRMINDGKKKTFQYILVWKLDRFARNRYDSAIYKADLKKHGVRVLSVTEGINEGSDSIILEAVLEAMAEEYSRQLSQNTRRGRRQNAEKGLTCGGHTPLGYQVIDKRFEICESETEVVRFIFESYAKGMGKKEIAAECNLRGWRTKQGKPFTVNSFYTLLKNPIYTGTYVFNGYKIPVTPIITPDRFVEVNKTIESHRRAPARSKAKVDYALQGKAFCGHCGAPMVGESGRGKSGTVYHYYACAAKKKHHTCDKKNEKKDFVEWYIAEQITTNILTDKKIKKIADGVVKAYNQTFDATAIKSMEKQLKSCDDELDALIDTLTKTTNQRALDRINEKIDGLDALRTQTAHDLASLKTTAKSTITAPEIVTWLNSFKNGDITSPDFRRALFDIFLNSVYIFDDKIVMFFNIHSTAQVSYLEMQSHLTPSKCSDLNCYALPTPSKSEHLIITANYIGLILTRS